MLGLFGTISNPTNYTNGSQGQGLFDFLGNLFKLIGVLAGIYLIIQLILAGFQYLSANGDAKKTEAAWAQIWQSLLGLVIISGAFILAGLISRLTGINILTPTIYGPSTN